MGRGRPINQSQWPGDRPRRTFFELIDEVHRDHGLKSLSDIAKAMNLAAKSRVSTLLRGTLPTDENQAKALIRALGGSDEDAKRGAMLYRTIRSSPAGPTVPEARVKDDGRAKPTVPPGFPGEGKARHREPSFPGMPQPLWRTRPHNPNFTGRRAELHELAVGLVAGSTVTVQTVRGMGGVGKTQLANEYAYRHAGDYDLIWEIAAEESASIYDQFATLAARLGLKSATDPEELRTQVHETLRRLTGWLLIFDNAAAPEDIAPWLPTGPLAVGARGHVIVTTRRGGFAAYGRVIELGVVDLPTAIQILRSRVPDLDQDAGERIADELGRLPLALEQAAAYMDRSYMPGKQYLKLLRDRAAELHRRGQVSSHKDTIATLWDISFGCIAENPAAAQLLEICAYLAPETIPLDLFTEHSELLPEPLSSAVTDELTLADTAAVLVDYSLAKRSPAGIQLHRLLQVTIRARRSAANHFVCDERHPDWLGGGWTSHPLEVALSLLQADLPAQVSPVPETWPKWTVLFQHVLAATNLVEDTLDKRERSTLIKASWLLNIAGSYLVTHARLNDARALVDRALTIHEAVYGPDHPNVGSDLTTLGQILRDLGQARQARPLLERALTIAETTYGPNHPTVAIALSNVASLKEADRLEEARPLLERALSIHETVYGPHHPYVGSILRDLGGMHSDLGQLEEARPLLERALTNAETAYGPSHPTVAACLGDLGAIHGKAGRPEEARPLLERALSIHETVYGPHHPTVALDLRNLAAILEELGQPTEGLRLLTRSLGITENAYGPDHPDAADTLIHLADFYRNLDQPEKAPPLLTRALTIAEKAYGPDQVAVFIILIKLISIHQQLDQIEEAQPLFERAVALAKAAKSGPEK